MAPQQLFTLENLIGTATDDVEKIVTPCRHVALFMGKRVLNEVWPKIVHWLRGPMSVDPQDAVLFPVEFVK